MATFSIPNMTCNHCKAKIEDAVLDLDEGAMLDFDMEARELDADTVLSEAQMIEAITGAGYEAAAKA